MSPLLPANLSPPLTVGVAFVRGLLAGLEGRGVDCAAELAQAGLTPAELGDDAQRVTVQQVASLLLLLITRHDDEALGMLAHPVRRGSFALQARAALGAPTLAVALRRVLHAFRLLHHGLELVPVRHGGLAGFALAFSDEAALRNHYLHEQTLRVYWRLLAWLVGGQLPVLRFDFAFARPSRAADYARIFPAPLQFNAARSAVWFDDALLQLPVTRDEAAFNAFLANGLVNVLLPGRDIGVSGRVAALLRQAQPGWPSLEQAAQALNMGVSTLQRHLGREGTSFQALKDHLRRDLATFRLRTSNLPLAKLAAELGFADTAAFQRAFKRWTGFPPGDYRRGQRAGRRQ